VGRAMSLADSALIESEPELPVLVLALAPERLESELRRVAPGVLGDARVQVHRLRYKPGTSLEAAVVIRGPHGERRWMRLAGYRRDDTAKQAKDLHAARARGVGCVAGDSGDAWSLVDVAGDRRLRVERLAARCGQWTPIAYNPGRRLVARGACPGVASTGVADVVAKLYRRGHGASVIASMTELSAAGGATVEVLAGSRGELLLTRWIPGRCADPRSDASAVVESLLRTRAAGAGAKHVAVDAEGLWRRCASALGSVAAVLPGSVDLTVELSVRLREAFARGSRSSRCLVHTGFVHGDLSPDQVVVSARGEAVMVDLDDCGRGPLDWDGASWVAAQVASGSPEPSVLPGEQPCPLMLAAALAARSPEPFQRRRPGWELTTDRMLEWALEALR